MFADSIVMRFEALIFGFILLAGCNPGESSHNDHITIGAYSLPLPSNYKVEEQKAFNAERGNIKTDSFTLQYEYSNHTKSPVLAPQEFIEEGKWQADIARDLFNKGLKDVHRIQFLSTRPCTDNDSMMYNGCDYIATCRYDSLVFDVPVYLPKSTKESRFRIDTFDSHYRIIFLANNPKKGKTGVFIKRLPMDAAQTSAFNTMAITTDNLTQSQQDTLLKAFLSIKVVAPK